MTSAAANLAVVLDAASREGGWSDDVAFVVGDRTFTHGAVHDGAARAASVLAGSGVAAGDRVLLALPDGMEFVWAFLGAVRLGAVTVPVNPRLTDADHRFAAEDSGATVVVCGADLAGRFAGRAVVGAEGLEGALGSWPAHPAAAVDRTQAAYAQYTSGTTGSPRAALHTHGDPPVYADAFAHPVIALGREDVVLSVSKLHFAYGLGNALFFPLLAGCRAVLHPGEPRPDAVADLVRRHAVTALFAVPTFYAHLVAAGRSADMASVRVAVSAGEPLVAALAERSRAFLGCPILDGLGSTEVGQTFASNTLAEWRDGTVGRALPPYRVAVRDDDGRESPPGSIGTLWVAGPTVLDGYLGRPGALAEAMCGEWFRTGDRAAVDGDGWVRLHGRSDDVELIGGISVSPFEIETVLSHHPAVIEVAVAGVVGDDGASRLQAFVVADPTAGPAEAVGPELVTMARDSLAPFKVPRSVAFVDALPRTPTGKLRRFVLRAGGWASSAGAGAQSPTIPPNRFR